MATLFEGYTLFRVESNQTFPFLGIEQGTDVDHVVVTNNSSRSVTVYKVSDQKPTGSWTVKQGQKISSSAVFNSRTQEYVVVTDNRVFRIWKEEEINMEKAFKATVSSDVYGVLSAADSEPVVLFSSGAVRFLDSLLSSPQQPIEVVLADQESMRWCTLVNAGEQPTVLFSTEQRGEHFLYVQSLNPNTLVKHRFENESDLSPIVFSATSRGNNIHLLYLYLNGCVYESVLPMRASNTGAEGVQALPRSMCLRLPMGDEVLLSAATAVVLDEAHIAVAGFPHPSAGPCKDYLCIWNTNFQTLQACKEMSGGISNQIWCFSGKLFIPHGKMLSVVPFQCQTSTLAAVMGKLKHKSQNEPDSHSVFSNWAEDTQESRLKSRNARVSSVLTVNQVVKLIKSAAVEDVEAEVGKFINHTPQLELQLAAGRVALELVSRSQIDATFYPKSVFQQLLESPYLCYRFRHSFSFSGNACPDLLLLAMVKKDFRLCQIAFRKFPDIPEAVTCACLKTVLSASDDEMQSVELDCESVIFLEAMVAPESNLEEDSKLANNDVYMKCPVGDHKAVLLNGILQIAYTDQSLMAHLKDLTVAQVLVFLEYLRYLYLKLSKDPQTHSRASRIPSLSQIIEWVCLVLDAHFTALALAPGAKELVSDLHRYTRYQVKLCAQLGKLEGSLHYLQKSKLSGNVGTYSIEVIELY
ncbi:hypothetical protein DNTS_009626 [Danionella cerebrum]|uniref:Nucleolar protein 11 n=1 Tax=Danionella cerebrum TaxID=2873325 RepID=A0A553PZ41_9TELE|nr:hypothetical protein DNTS_009626 [Danionella translucida]